MASLIQDADTVRSFVHIGIDFTFEVIKPYVEQAERQHIVTILGQALYDSWISSAPTTGTTKQAYDLFREAGANLALVKYLPFATVAITDVGIYVNSSEYTKPAEWWQVRDLKRSLITAGNLAIDEALKIMEANEGDFAGWSSTEGYTVFKELVVRKTEDLQRFYNINHSRLVFLAVRPMLLESQNQLLNWLDATTLSDLKDPGAVAIKQQGSDYCKGAVANLAIAKAAASGLFEFTVSGIFLRSRDLPGDKTKELNEAQIQKIVKDRQESARQYLKILQQFIIDNAATFSGFTESTEELDLFYHDTNSIFTL